MKTLSALVIVYIFSNICKYIGEYFTVTCTYVGYMCMLIFSYQGMCYSMSASFKGLMLQMFILCVTDTIHNATVLFVYVRTIK